jgi:transcription elongation factor GreA
LEPTETITLLQAVGIYAGSIKAGDNDEDLHRELHKFVNWCGPDRAFAEISPPEVGDYADQVAGTGTTPQAAERLQIIRGFLSYARKKGLLERNLAQHVRIRKARVKAGARGAGDAPETAELTKAGHAELVAQGEKLRIERAAIAMEIQRAAADKDVRENAPLEAAREESGRIDARLRQIEETLKSAVIIDASKRRGKAVSLGCRVVVNEVDVGRKTSYTLVHPSEAKPLESRISDISPLGKALMGRSVGQEIVVQSPRGKTRYKIVEVTS